MIELGRFAGHFAGHAVWCISEDGPLVPFYGYELASEQRGLDRLVVSDSGEAQSVGRQRLQENPHSARRGVLLYDAFVNRNGRRRDAIIIEASDYESRATFTVVVPYRPFDSVDGFGVYPAELMAFDGFTIQRTGDVLAPFSEGVDTHEKGAAVWDSHSLEPD